MLGLHGETSLAKPFLWQSGKLIPLPAGKGVYGHVLGGSSKGLVGDADVERHRDMPVRWTPDAKLGWSQAKLEVLAKEPGRALCETGTGDVWVQTRKDVIRIRGGAVRRFLTGKFDLNFVDSRGVLYGNRYEGGGYRQLDTRPATIVSMQHCSIPTPAPPSQVLLPGTSILSHASAFTTASALMWTVGWRHECRRNPAGGDAK